MAAIHSGLMAANFPVCKYVIGVVSAEEEIC
jgi:hypothetical protein